MEREISLRRLLADMLKIDQYGMTDAAFRETVRLELTSCIEAKHKLREMELGVNDRGTAAPVSPSRRSNTLASAPATASTPLVNSSTAAAAGSYVHVANVNRSFDMLIERAWGYRKRLSEVKEEVLEHWEVSACMHELYRHRTHAQGMHASWLAQPPIRTRAHASITSHPRTRSV